MIYLFTLLVCSCTIEPIVAPDFNIPITGVKTTLEAVQWTATNVTYQYDILRDYWKTPEETYRDRTGDCEDFSLMAMYLIRKEVGLDPHLVIGWKTSQTVGPCHAWLVCNGIDYDPIYGVARTWMRDNFGDIIEEYDYQTAMNLAYARHSRKLAGTRE